MHMGQQIGLALAHIPYTQHVIVHIVPTLIRFVSLTVISSYRGDEVFADGVDGLMDCIERVESFVHLGIELNAGGWCSSAVSGKGV